VADAMFLLWVANMIQPITLSKLALGFGLVTFILKGLLIWAFAEFYDWPESPVEMHPLEVIEPATQVVSVVALLGVIITCIALLQKQRGRMVYSALILCILAFLVNPFVYAIY
jgi:hypothetical protein